MLRKLALLTLIAIGLTGCAQNTQSEPTAPAATEPPVPTTDSDPIGLPNPASVYCEEQGYTLEIRTDADGGQFGICLFPDGSECEEWAYYRDECQPGDSLATPAATGWQRYQNDTLGYHFDYPADATIEIGDDPYHAITILGALEDGDHWPMIFVSHPQQEESYQLPAGTDLAQWLIEQNLLPPDDQQPASEVRQADVQIAGETAVHTRFNRSPQSYAYDKYFFAHESQIYAIVILHSGDKEDWDLYNQFLQSFQFES